MLSHTAVHEAAEDKQTMLAVITHYSRRNIVFGCVVGCEVG